jgi:hypothetical protein
MGSVLANQRPSAELEECGCPWMGRATSAVGRFFFKKFSYLYRGKQQKLEFLLRK